MAGIVCSINNEQNKQNRTMANLNAMTYAERMKTDIMKGIGVSDTLRQIIISNDGQLNKFYEIAEEMMTDSVQSIQIAPGGVVTDIYPQEGNDAGKINLLNDKDRGEICRYGRDNKVVTMQGPFQLKQGEYGIAVRKPVYIEENGHEDFWGFTIVIIRVPEIFADSMKALSDFGYNYTLYKTAFPWESEFEEVYGSEEELKNPVSYTFDIGDSKWKLDIMPYKTQSERIYLYAVGIGGIIIVLLLTGFTCALLVLDEHRKKFKKLAITDALTGINNRHGYDERVTRYLKQNPDNHCVGVEFDIDDFKTINDMYGHAYGDVALKVLSEGMQKFFDKNVLLGRNGGDEFCIFLPDCTCADVKEKLEEFTKLKRSFKYEGEEHQFTISVGYAEYPVHADKPSKLMRCADTALYEVKLRGKNGCMAYKNGLRKDIRTQLGFALKDVSENLPGAFIIYKADKNDDEILFANREFIRFAGCKNMDELLVYTKRSFRNIIRVDEREAVIADIWKQIDEGHTNGYTHFYMQKADGGHIQVFDHGRIVDMMTIRQRKGRLNNLTIGFCGDLKFGRTVHSLVSSLTRFSDNKFYFISPEELRIPDYLRDDVLNPSNSTYEEVSSLEDTLPKLDVLYMTRVQKERFFNEEEYLRLKDVYILDEEKLKLADKDMPVLHPLPRVDEISLDVDDNPRAAYFDQVQNGKYIRMALIMALLGITDPVTGRTVLDTHSL